MTKRYLMYVAGKNLGVIMRALFGMGKPRTLQTEGGGGFSLIWARIASHIGLLGALSGELARRLGLGAFWPRQIAVDSGGVTTREIAAAA